MRGRRGAVIVAVVAVVGLAVTLHALEITSIQRVSHDDTISYLAATGHQGEYQQVVDSASAPVAQWVPASRWQAFTRIEDPLPLLTIARDLGHHDIHPPVYFWLLHMWMLLFGGSLWTGPMLNVVIHVLTAVVLWRLAAGGLGCRRHLGDAAGGRPNRRVDASVQPREPVEHHAGLGLHPHT
jgi:uncharacterized membrane protein